MLVVERHRKIVAALNEHTSLRVTALAEMFGVTEETIRRDLERLQAQGRLVRSHGGAVRAEPDQELSYFQRETQRVRQKRAIAAAAIPLVAEDDTIMMDPSSTVHQMARLLPDMPLTVVTNSVKVALELASRPRIQVISTGGQISDRSLSYLGPLTHRNLEDYRARRFFFSCKGVSAEGGVSEADELQATVKKIMMERSEERYLLADSSKLGRRSLSAWGKVENLTALITDEGATPAQMAPLAACGLDIRKA